MIEDVKVTIYIPTFNRCDLLTRAVNSVLNQSYRNIEVIVVDDCSTDGTHHYLKEIAQKDSRVNFFIKDKNSGAPISRNIAIDKASGTYITGLDDDDYFLPDRIEKFIKNAELLNEYEYLYSNYVYEKENLISKNKGNSFKQPKKIKFNDLLLTNYVGNQIFTYTDRLKKLGGFDVDLKAWQDLELWLRLLNDRSKSAKFLNDETYVVNKNFDIPRITLQNKGPKIIESYEHICEKLLLNPSLRKTLALQMTIYGVKVPISYLISALVSVGISIGFLYNLMFLIKLNLKNLGKK